LPAPLYLYLSSPHSHFQGNRISVPRKTWNTQEEVKTFLEEFGKKFNISKKEDWYWMSIVQVERSGGKKKEMKETGGGKKSFGVEEKQRGLKRKKQKLTMLR
jgi:hypothetical protein